MTAAFSASLATLAEIFFLVLLPCCAALGYFSRKIGADLQARVGPNRAGPGGVFQPLADFLKSLQKEDVASSGSRVQQLSLAFQSAILLSTMAVLPLSSALLLVDSDMSAFLAFWAAFTVALISLFVGLQRGTMPGWLSGLRIATQAVTGAFPALVAMLCVGAQTGSFRWENILAAQGASPFSWMVFSNPFAPFAFLVFVVSGLILFSAEPMDSGNLRPELAGGISSIWGGRELALVGFTRFYGFFLWACMAATLFLGGWRIPQGIEQALAGGTLVVVLQTVTLLIKVFALMLVVAGISRVNPKTRADQITAFAWQVLSPTALLALVGSAAWRYWLR